MTTGTPGTGTPGTPGDPLVDLTAKVKSLEAEVGSRLDKLEKKTEVIPEPSHKWLVGGIATVVSSVVAVVSALVAGAMIYQSKSDKIEQIAWATLTREQATMYQAVVDQLLELAAGRIAQHCGGLEVVSGSDGDGDFAKAHIDALCHGTQGALQGGLEGLGINRESGGRHRGVFQARAMVWVRRIFCCSWMIPYSSASAVGGQPGT